MTVAGVISAVSVADGGCQADGWVGGRRSEVNIFAGLSAWVRVHRLHGLRPHLRFSREYKVLFCTHWVYPAVKGLRL